MHEAVAAGDWPPLDVDVANVFSLSELVLQARDHVHKHDDATRRAQQGSKLHGLELIVDPSDEIIKVLLAALQWDMGYAAAQFWTRC